MSEGVTSTRLSKAAREFNIGIKTVVDFLIKKGFPIEMDPNAKLSSEMYNLLMKEFASEKHVKEEAKKIGLQFTAHETITIEDKKSATKDREKELDDLFIKNVSMDFEKKQYEAAKKTREVVAKEPVKEEKKAEAAPPPPVEVPKAPPVVKEEIVAVPMVVEEKPEIPAPVVEIVEAQQAPVPEHAEKISIIPEVPAKSEEPAEETPYIAESQPEVEPEPAPDQKPRNDLKIVGMMDLGVFDKKPTKKAKGKPEPAPADVTPVPVREPEKEEPESMPEIIEVLPPVILQIEEIPVAPEVIEPV